MALGQKHKVSIKLEDYLHCIIGDKKIGKSTLVADIAEELYGGIDKLLILSIKNEKAYEAIDGAIYEEPQTWGEVMKVVDEFVKGDHDFKMLSFDTIDELIELATQEVIKLHTKEYKEIPKSFNACFGGYGEPRKKLQSLINELLDKIKDTGYGYYFIGHNKTRTIKSKIDDDDYVVVTSNLSTDYFNAIAYKCPIICNIVSDVETNKKGALSDKLRFMHFRDDAYVEAGSRFSELPVKVPYGAKEYIDAVTNGIQASIDKKRKGKKVKVKSDTKPKTENVKKEESKQEKPKQSKKEEPKVDKKAKIQEIRDEFGKLVKEKGMKNGEVLDIMAKNGTNAPSEETDIKTLEKILQALKDVK